MGMDPATWAIIGSSLLGAGSQIYGASNQNSTNTSNLNAQLDHQRLIQQYVNGMIQPGANPFAQAIMQFAGRGVPGSFNGFSGIPLGGQGSGYTGAGTGSGPASPTGPDNPNPPNPNTGGTDGATTSQAPAAAPQMAAFQTPPITAAQVIQQAPSVQPQQQLQQQQIQQASQPSYQPTSQPAQQQPLSFQDFASQYDFGSRQEALAAYDQYQQDFGAPSVMTQPTVPGYTGGFSSMYPSTDAQPNTNPQGNVSGTPAKQWTMNDPRTQQEILQQDYNGDYNAFLAGSPNPSVAALGAALQSGNQTAISQATAALQSPANQTTQSPIGSGGVYGVGGNEQPIPGSDTRYLQNGVYRDASGNILGYSSGSGTPNNGMFPSPPTPTYGGVTGIPPVQGGGQPNSTDMWRYQSPGAYTVNPTLLGNAPQVTAPQISAQQIGGLPQITPSQVTPGQGVTASQIQAPTITAPSSSQGFNAGQDGLLQLMNKQLSPVSDPSLSLNLQGMGTNGNPFDNSDLFKALGAQDQSAMNQQVGALHASAGSLGERFGTAMGQNEALLRTQLTNANATRNAQIAQSSFESAQSRRMQALGLQSTNDQAANQFTLNNAGLNLNAAQSAAGNALQGSAQGLQAGIANAGNSLTSQQLNQAAGLNAGQFNAQQGMQSQLANQQAGLTGQQSNLDAFLRAMMANQSAGLTASQTNAQTGMQAGLANQNILGQYATSNANIANQANQFNAGQLTGENQFNAGQQQTWNSQIMQALMSAANIQQGQTGQNSALVGILNGVGVPQAVPNQLPGAIGDASSSAMMLPFLLQMLGGRQGAASYTQSPYSYAPYGGSTPA